MKLKSEAMDLEGCVF